MLKLLWYVGFAVLTVLSIATGVTKLVRFPQEMALFAGAGFSETGTVLFGGVQLVAGLLLFPAKTRQTASVVMVLTFIIASYVVHVSGMKSFFWVSLLFILLAALPVLKPRPPAPPESSKQT